MIFTFAELEADRLINSRQNSCSNAPNTIHESANRIIELAERIKAERAVVTMERVFS